VLITDPGSAARARAAIEGKVLVLGGVGEVPWQPGEARTLPAGVIDMESIDPETVTLPTWYKPDPAAPATSRWSSSRREDPSHPARRGSPTGAGRSPRSARPPPQR